MKKRVLGKRNYSAALSFLLPIFIFAAVLTIVYLGLSGAAEGTEREGVQLAQEAVTRAAVSCYAAEGRYPESYEYLRDNYDLAVNEDKYTVFYSVFASNIMPDITVVAKDGAA